MTVAGPQQTNSFFVRGMAQRAVPEPDRGVMS
jgi:hypothetical protein